MRLRSVLVTAALGLVAVSLLLTAVTSPVVADTEYEISVEGSVDTPTRTVELEGATYNVSAIGKAQSGESIDVSVQAPDPDQDYNVYLYNSDRQIVEGESGEGNDTVTFDLTDLDAGTYVFAVQERGANQVIHPFVIKGFDTTIDAPASATVGDDVTVDVTTDRLSDNATNDRVEVVIAGDDQLTRTTATGSDDTFTATVDTGGLDPGSYRVYANIRGEEVVFDERVIFGVSDAQTLDLEEAESDDSGSSGGVGSGSQTTTADPATGTDQAPTTSADSTTLEPSTSTPTSDQSVTDDTAPTSGQASDGTGEDPTTETAEVLSPNQSQTTTDTVIPGFQLWLVGVVSLIFALVAKLSDI
ncbi:hypothetical protein [Halobellus salinus]|nr:hypothetical protein [Halobellus salinus]SMP13004.1 hypothetical protein SAMN06265347_104128 [Halobellus salinus]